MAREFFDYDPLTGITTWTEHGTDINDESVVLIHRTQDVQPLLDYCEKLRNENIHTVKDEFFHYAKIPTVVQMELLKKGLDIYSNDESVLKRIRQEIEANYPKLKTSHAKHV